MTRDELLARHTELTVDLASAYRDQAMHAAAEAETKATAYMTYRALPVTEREQMARAMSLNFTKLRISYDGEVRALEALLADVAAHLPYVRAEGP